MAEPCLAWTPRMTVEVGAVRREQALRFKLRTGNGSTQVGSNDNDINGAIDGAWSLECFRIKCERLSDKKHDETNS